LPGIKTAGAAFKRLSLVLLALAYGPAAAEESLTNFRPLQWQDGLARGTVDADATAVAGAADAASAEEAAAESADAAIASETDGDPTAGADAQLPVAILHVDVWDRIRHGFGINEEASRHPLVGLHESWFAARPENVVRLVERARPYLYHIVEQLDQRAMPMEIALLPMIESAFNPAAVSPASASGIWQFMPATGRHYGLKQDNWYDGRGDFTAATRAALDYLAKLYLDFGDWQLALAAYNCGEGCVARAIRKNADEGLPTDYASLALPNETRHYVPRLLAIKNMIQNPEQYGLEIEPLPNQAYFDKVTVRASMDVHSAARLANMTSADFTRLNAAFPRKLIHSDTPVNLLLPVDRVDTFQRNLQTETWDTWKPHTVKKGERPQAVAKRFGVSLARLAEHNQFQLKRGKFKRAQTILVPVKGRKPAPEKPATRETEHVVRRGDTLFGVALRYGVTVSQLSEANPKMGQYLKVGQVVRLPAEKTAGAQSAAAASAKTGAKKSGARTVRYTVRRGDSLGKIAERFDVGLVDLKTWNPAFRKTSTVQVGQKIVVKQP
jgi:membrane-bound lytic murein transglycosylase D